MSLFKFKPPRVFAIIRPGRLFLIMLGLIFVVESGIMILLPKIMPTGSGELRHAVIDAFLLNILLGPVLWWLVIVPLRELADVRSALLDRLLKAQEEERGRIARDLHDGLGQLLTCLQVGLRAVEESTTDEALQQRLRDLRQVGSQTHEEIRRMASGLRPTVLDDLGLGPALLRYCSDLNRTEAVKASVTATGLSAGRLPSEIETACYRVVQEATTNAMRHGAAREVIIDLKITGPLVNLEIRDNGCGFDPEAVMRRSGAEQPIGLWSIRERVESLHGTVSVESVPGDGTVVKVLIPVPNTEERYGEDSSVGG